MFFSTLIFLAFITIVLGRFVNEKLNTPGDFSPKSPDSDPIGTSDTEKETPVFDAEPVEEHAPMAETVRETVKSTEDIEEQPEPRQEPAAKSFAGYGHLFGLIGKPLGHSTSMVRFNKFFREQHINAHYENFELDSIEHVTKLVEENPNLCGFNVTIPYKQDIIPYLNKVDETAQAIGAVNTVKVLHTETGTELIGYNTDWIGFTESFKQLLEGHSKALILGTGGVSKAVKYALDKLGIESRFVSRNSTFDIMGYYELSPSVMEEYDVIVNCTPMGMWPDINQCPDIPYTFISDRHVLLDVIANPDETLFMKKGREHGAQAKGGKDMLEQQAVGAWNIWNS